MRRRTRPWPAFVDLFSSLFIIVLGGYILSTRGIITPAALEQAELRNTVAELANQVETLLKQDNTLKSRVEKIGDDVVIHLYIHFARGEAEILDGEQLNTLRQLGLRIKQAIDALGPDKKRLIRITIEGHTDAQQISRAYGEKERYLYNWHLSALRAISVLYEFKKLGLSPEEYAISAIGYADTKPLCTEPTPECYALNRRTTIRLEPNVDVIFGKKNPPDTPGINN